MKMKTIKIGIMSQQEIRERTLAIAQGKYKPKFEMYNNMGNILYLSNK